MKAGERSTRCLSHAAQMQTWSRFTFCRVRGAGSGLLARHRGFFNEIQRVKAMSNTCVRLAGALIHR